MLAQVAAAEFTIDRPQTMMEAAVFAAVLFTVIFIFVRGLKGFVGRFNGALTDYFWWVFGFLIVIFLYTYRPWETDPMLEADIELPAEGIQGTQAESDPGD